MAVKKAKYKRKNAQGQYDTYHFETETAQVLGLTDFVKSLGYVHPNSGVGAGTYKSVTVNTQGHVTAGTNPTTLAGYGITDAAGIANAFKRSGTIASKGRVWTKGEFSVLNVGFYMCDNAVNATEFGCPKNDTLFNLFVAGSDNARQIGFIFFRDGEVWRYNSHVGHGTDKMTSDYWREIVLKSAENDIDCRLVKQTYADQATIGGGLVFRTNATTDNYLRVCNNIAAIKTYLGLGNVNNTADSVKPISTAVQTALNTKAPIASPALTGTPTAPTAAAATNNTQIATTAFVKAVAAPLSHAHNYAASASAGGAANTAVKLATARALKLGNTAKNFDGSANLTWTLAEMGATAATMGGIVGGSLAQNGWVKFANGLILQWGSCVTLAGSSWAYAYAKFPIAFPSANYCILTTHLGTDTVVVSEKLDEHGTTQTTLLAKNSLGTNASGWIVRWFAVGF